MNLKQIIDYFKSLQKPKRNPKLIQVVIDAGHGGDKDWGLNTIIKGKRTPNKGYNGILEKDVNLELSMRIAWLCARHSIGFLLTRFGDRYISLSERCKRSNSVKPRLFLSIHNNYALNPKIKGLETFYYQNSTLGKALAEKCQKLLDELGYTRNRYVKGAKFKVLKSTKAPAILVECGYLSNKDDATFLNNENNQMLIAAQIFELIREVCI